MEGSMSAQAETLGHFGDARRASVGKKLLARVIELGTLVIRKLGLDRAGEKQIHRFLDSPAVTCEEMIETASTQTIEACRGEKVIVVQDTTEINPRVKPDGKLFWTRSQSPWSWSGGRWHVGWIFHSPMPCHQSKNRFASRPVKCKNMDS
jgi:hypothetical protein